MVPRQCHCCRCRQARKLVYVALENGGRFGQAQGHGHARTAAGKGWGWPQAGPQRQRGAGLQEEARCLWTVWAKASRRWLGGTHPVHHGGLSRGLAGLKTGRVELTGHGWQARSQHIIISWKAAYVANTDRTPVYRKVCRGPSVEGTYPAANAQAGPACAAEVTFCYMTAFKALQLVHTPA